MATSLPTGLSNPRWDPWLLYDDGMYRAFYLSGRVDQSPWWKTSWICTATSTDMRRWQHHGAVLSPLQESTWESGRIFAGSAYVEKDAVSDAKTYYLFYSAASASAIDHEHIGLATSSDGKRWQRSPRPLLSFSQSTGITTSTGIGYAGRCNWNNHLHWRDPYVLHVPETQQYYLFFCASVTAETRYQGGLGVAVSSTLGGPYQLLPPAAGPAITPEESPWPFYHLERPQVIHFGGQYHLFFSCFKDFVDPEWVTSERDKRVTDSTLYWYVSDRPTGPFRAADSLPTVPGSESTGLYGTTFSPQYPKSTWTQIAASQVASLNAIGWYSKTYQLEISQRFTAVWSNTDLRLVKH